MSATFALTIESAGSGLRNTERGWYLFDSMRESAGRSDYAWQTLAEAIGETDPLKAYLPATAFVAEINALICRPYPRTQDSIPIGEWIAVGGGSTTWETLTGINNLDTNWYQQTDSSLTSENGLCMAYAAPPNPAFGVCVRRYDLPADWDYSAYGAGYTRIVWGGGAFELWIPFHGTAALYDVARDFKTEVPLGRHGHRGGRSDTAQEFTVWIMHLGGRILISDDTRSWFVYSQGKATESHINVEAGGVQVTNVGASWSFALLPIDFPGVASYVSKTYDKGYTPSSTLEGGAPGGDWCDARWNTWPGYAEPDVAVTILSGDDRYCQYQADLVPTRYPVGSTWFAHTPELYAVRIQNKPVCTDIASAGAPTISENDVLGIEVEDASDMDAGRARLLVNNTAGTYETFPEYTRLSIALAASDGSLVSVFSGYCYQPQGDESTSSGKRFRLDFRSAFLPLMEVGCVEGEPVFAGKTIGEALEWACLRCGITHTASDWADTPALPTGELGSRTFQPAAGRSWMEFLREVCSIEQAYLRFSGWRLTYNPATQGTPVATWYFADRHAYPGAPAGTIPMLGEVEIVRDPTNHRNEVVVIGQDVDGRVMVAKQVDTGNRAAVGWEKTVVVQDSAYDTQERVNLVCRTLSRKVFPYPPRQATWRIEGNPALYPRSYALLYGGVSRYHLGTFEIQRVVSRWEQSSPLVWFQDVDAKWLR